MIESTGYMKSRFFGHGGNSRLASLLMQLCRFAPFLEGYASLPFAAAVAKIPPMATGLMAWKITKGLYIVPLLIAYTPFSGQQSAGDAGDLRVRRVRYLCVERGDQRLSEGPGFLGLATIFAAGGYRSVLAQ